jgi:hypothetical protein
MKGLNEMQEKLCLFGIEERGKRKIEGENQ